MIYLCPKNKLLIGQPVDVTIVKKKQIKKQTSTQICVPSKLNV